MKTEKVAMLAASLLLLAGLAIPMQASAAPEGSHDTGFMLRYTAGGSFARTSQKAKDVDAGVYLQAPAVDMDLALGYAFTRSFAIHATAGYWQMFNPKVGGNLGGVSGETDVDAKIQNAAFGGGVTAWTPGNVYFSASLMAAMLRGTYNGSQTDTDWGVGLDLLLGKEWWLSDNVGLGLAAGGTVHYIPTSGDNHLLGFSVGPRLSLTIN